MADSRVQVVFANGFHRKHTPEEQRALIGDDFVRRFHVDDHYFYDAANTMNLGHTKRGTPVEVNRKVMEADLRILSGLIKPHGMAGYSGGGKAILREYQAFGPSSPITGTKPKPIPIRMSVT